MSELSPTSRMSEPAVTYDNPTPYPPAPPRAREPARRCQPSPDARWNAAKAQPVRRSGQARRLPGACRSGARPEPAPPAPRKRPPESCDSELPELIPATCQSSHRDCPTVRARADVTRRCGRRAARYLVRVRRSQTQSGAGPSCCGAAGSLSPRRRHQEVRPPSGPAPGPSGAGPRQRTEVERPRRQYRRWAGLLQARRVPPRLVRGDGAGPSHCTQAEPPGTRHTSHTVCNRGTTRHAWVGLPGWRRSARPRGASGPLRSSTRRPGRRGRGSNASRSVRAAA
jgi:hypothetical protein